jgi:hypothetical protein
MINAHFSGRLVAAGAPVADGGHRLLLAEPGASGGKLVEPVHAPCLADLGDQIGFLSPQQWPGVQADPPAQAEARITDGGRGGSGVPGAPPDSPG